MKIFRLSLQYKLSKWLFWLPKPDLCLRWKSYESKSWKSWNLQEREECWIRTVYLRLHKWPRLWRIVCRALQRKIRRVSMSGLNAVNHSNYAKNTSVRTILRMNVSSVVHANRFNVSQIRNQFWFLIPRKQQINLFLLNIMVSVF